MTEPDNAGSELPRSIQTTAKKEGDEWVINGHKVMTSNGIKADFAIVRAEQKKKVRWRSQFRMTQIIVPTDSGFNVIRSVPIWGHTGGIRRN